MSTITTMPNLRLLHPEEVDNEVQGITRGQERGLPVRLSPAAARTIASWWQSSGEVGAQLAALASGSPVDRDALLADVDRTIAQAEEDGPSEDADDHARDLRALARLREWVATQ